MFTGDHMNGRWGSWQVGDGATYSVCNTFTPITEQFGALSFRSHKPKNLNNE
jgi:hypothetical protein